MTSTAEKLAAAVRDHQAGNLAAAEQVYGEILTSDPYHADALHLLGLIALKKGRAQDGHDFMARAIRVKPKAAEFRSNLALAVMELGDLKKAVASCQEALRLKPDYPQAWHNLAIALQRQGRFNEAVSACRRALQLRPDDPRAHFTLGVGLWELAQRDSAVQALKQAVTLDADYVEAYDRLGVALRDQGNLAEAATACQRALAIQPNYVPAINTLGTVALRQGEHATAIRLFRDAIQRAPDFLEAHHNLSVALKDYGMLEAAAEACRQAIACRPTGDVAHKNLSTSLRQQGRFREAIAECEKAIATQHERAAAQFKLASKLHDQGDLEGAKAGYLQVTQLDQDHADAHKNLAMILLAQGDFLQGWKEYEWRWRSDKPAPFEYEGPRWEGQPSQGKTVLVYAEQGLGDTIQFIRFLKLVKSRAGRVILACQPQLVRLLRNVAGVDQVVPRGQAAVTYDYQVPLLSLPLLFHTNLDTIADDVPYLAAEPSRVAKWQERIHRHSGRRVGIFWQGSPTFARDQYRSIPLEHFVPLADIPDVTLLSFQKGHGVEQLQSLKVPSSIIEVGSQFQDFLDTAAALMCLDLFITSDTAVAHLAGALGVPVWLATSYVPDWRWMLSREDSPWYPTMRLFRQTQRGDWTHVFDRIQAELRRDDWRRPVKTPSQQVTQRVDPAQLSEPHQASRIGGVSQEKS